MTPFTYERPANSAGAIALRARAGAMHLGGGTNLVDLMRETIERPAVLVDVTGLSRDVDETPDGGLSIGAGVKNTAVAADRRVRERYPLLAQAILSGASAQIRNVATVGGKILQRTRCGYSHDDAARLKPMPPFMSQPKAAGGGDVPIMQDDQVHWNGQPIALVLAETQEQADHAQSLIRVTYEPGDGVTTLEAAKAKGSEPGVFQGEPLPLDLHQSEQKLAAAPHKVDVRYSTPRRNHNPIELHAATLFWDGDSLRRWPD